MRQRRSLLARHADFLNMLEQFTPLQFSACESAARLFDAGESPLLQFGGYQVAVQQNSGQQIIEVVRDSSRQPPDDFHLLCFAQVFFHLPALGRIREHCDQEGGLPSRVAAEGHRQMSPELGTVLAPIALFNFERAALVP